MQINIKNNKTYELAAHLAQLTGETLTQAVTTAIAERLERAKQSNRKKREGLAEKLLQFAQERCNQYPLLDTRDHADILYDKDGLPKSEKDI